MNNQTQAPASPKESLQLISQWPSVLMWSVMLLLPFGRFAGLPVLMMSIIGLWLCLGRWHEVKRLPGIVLLLALFACFWLPVAISTLDAVNLEKSGQTALALLRFLPLGVFALYFLRDEAQRTTLLNLTAGLVAFWCIDALIQAVVGYNTLGFPHSPDRLNGIFGATNIKLGHMVALLSPFMFEVARARRRRIWLMAAFGLAFSVVILSGTRAAWVMFAVIAPCYLYLYARTHPRRWIKSVAVLLTAALLVGWAGYQISPTFAERVDRSMLLFSSDTAAIDRALSHRLPIWRSALAMAQSNPVNGVGARGFRYAYGDYSDGDDPWLDDDTEIGASHAHQLLLEVMTETGGIGIFGLLLGLALALRRWRQTAPIRRHATLGYAIALVAILFPVNTHLAFYSTFWSLAFWWLVILFCVHTADDENSDASPVGIHHDTE